MDALRMKLAWAVKYGSNNGPRVLLMHSKYRRDSSSETNSPSHQMVSLFWKKIRNFFPTLLYNVRCTVGHGEANLWKQNWIGNGPLHHLANRTISQEVLDLKLKDLLGRAGPLPPSRVFDFLPQGVIDGIFQGGFAISEDEPSCLWPHESSSVFFVASAWKILRVTHNAASWGKWIWHPSLPPKVSLFMWRLLQEATPVDDRVQAQGVAMVSKCRCYDFGDSHNPQTETVNHLFLAGKHASAIWNHFQIKLGISASSHISVEGRLRQWRSAAAPGSAPVSVRILLPLIILWEILRSRNDAVFANKPTIVQNSIARINWWARQVIHDAHVPSSPFLQSRRRSPDLIYCHSSVLVKWKRPSSGWVKQNVDGFACGNPGPLGGGSICRNELGAFIFAFSAGYGEGLNNLAELRAVHDGMAAYIDKGLLKAEVESDSKIVTDVILGKCPCPWRWKPWVNMINLLKN